MRTTSRALRSILRFCGSIKLAMLLLLAVIVGSIAGTLIESRFDASVARAYVYDSPWFYGWLFLLCVNLIGAVVVRYPWKAHQTGFIITHGAIVLILIGGVIGRIWGVEGHVTLVAGEKPHDFLVVNDPLLQVQRPGNGTESFRLRLDLRRPTPDRPFRYRSGDLRISVLEIADELGIRDVVRPTAREGAPAVRLTLTGPEFPHPIEKWLLQGHGQPNRLPVGSDLIRFASANGSLSHVEAPDGHGDGCCPTDAASSNGSAPASGAPREFTLRHDGGDSLVWVNLADPTSPAQPLAAGSVVSPPGVNWTLRVDEVLENAVAREELRPLGEPGLRRTGASGLRVRFEKDGESVERWLRMGSMAFVPLGGEALHAAFGFRMYPIDFSVALDRFEVEFNPGTDSPASFSSHLLFTDESGDTLRRSISMNKPTTFPESLASSLLGTSYKFAQSSWDANNLDQTTLQIIRDPGWSLKWIGSLLFCVGLVTVFYLKPYPRFQRNRSGPPTTEIPSSKADGPAEAPQPRRRIQRRALVTR